MDYSIIEVIKPGMLTTVQDLGRTGYQQFGMVVAGAMDPYALRMANLIVGNSEHSAGLEITISGPVLKLTQDVNLAITGADLSPIIDGKPIPMWTSIYVKAHSVLKFGSLKNGCRSYLAINGGIDAPLIMGSRSTYLRGGIGGLNGRALKAGDSLSREMGLKMSLFKRRRLSSELIPKYEKNISLRVIQGPQWDCFGKNSQARFLNEKFQITPQSDRMGYRLTGKPLALVFEREQITDPIPNGAIQVPSDGNPIVLLADRQTTGGYPKIATIISVDLPKLAQGKPGDEVCFKVVDLEESHRLLREQERIFRIIGSCLK